MTRSCGMQRGRAVAGPVRNGFTLVELLVVVSILGILFAMILGGGRPSIGSEVRRAAQEFASVLLATQSRAIGRPTGAGVVLESSGATCSEVADGQRPPFVVGTVPSGMPPPDLAAPAATVAITPTNGGNPQQGYRIQFFATDPAFPSSAWFGFVPPTTVRFRTEDGQSPANTVWPSAAGGLTARIVCYPAKGSELMEFPKTVAIDLRYSGTGDDPATTWGSLATTGDAAVCFDAVGEADSLLEGVGGSATIARQPIEPVYFLVAARADIEKDQALASERSLWVVIQPLTGRVTVSANVPQGARNRDAVRAARANARAALVVRK